jgi:hypothetical protein
LIVLAAHTYRTGRSRKVCTSSRARVTASLEHVQRHKRTHATCSFQSPIAALGNGGYRCGLVMVDLVAQPTSSAVCRIDVGRSECCADGIWPFRHVECSWEV